MSPTKNDRTQIPYALSRCREIIEQGIAGYVTLTGVRDA